MLKTYCRNLFTICVLCSLTLLLSSCGSLSDSLLGLSSERIMNRYAEATGEAKLPKPKSVFFKAKVSQFGTTYSNKYQQNSYPTVRVTGMSLYCEFPNKIYLNNSAAVIGSNGFNGEYKIADVQVIQVYDGQSGWEITNSVQGNLNKTRELLFFEIDKLKKIAESTSSTNTLSKLMSPKYIGEQTIDYNVMQPGFGTLIKKNTNVIEALTNEGKKQSLFFDVSDGLLLRTEEIDLVTNDKTSTTLINYKDFGGIKMASTIILYKVINKTGAREDMIFDIEEFQLNAATPLGAFIKPAL